MTNEYSYQFPKRIINNKNIHEIFSIFFYNCKNFHDTNIFLDFSSVRWIEPNLIAMLGLILTKLSLNGNIIIFRNIKESVRILLNKYNFLRKESYSDSIPQNYITYSNFNGDDIDSFKLYISDRLKDLNDYPYINDLKNRLFEIFINVKMHARADSTKSKYKNKEIFCSGYYNKNQNYLSVSIANNGRTFAETIYKKLSYVFDEEYKYIEWALRKSNTTRINEPGGLGLYLVLSLIEKLSGELFILSGKGYYEFSKSSITSLDIAKPFPGTIITITVPISFNNTFKLNTFETSVDLIDLIKGET